MADHHIVTQFDEELNEMRALIAQMGGLVEQQMADAIAAVSRRHAALPRRCQEADAEIDRMGDKVQDSNHGMPAVRRPGAFYLRAATSVTNNATTLDSRVRYKKA